MNPITRTIALALAAALPLAMLACDSDPDSTAGAGHKDSGEPDALPSNRVSIPTAVRSNLGISFVTVERRRIEQTLRVPGRFEYLPSARREYRTMLPGRIEQLVHQFDRVKAGAPLYRIDSPSWREMQQQLTDAQSSIHRYTTKLNTYAPLLAAHSRHEESLHESITVWKERVDQLQSVREAGGGRMDQLAQARSALASTQAGLAEVQEKKAELHAGRDQTKADVDASRARFNYLLDSASAIVDHPRAHLIQTQTTDHGDKPRWATINTIEVRATEEGIVESLGLTNGSWADPKTPVLTIVQPDRLRFRASGLQSDLGVLRDGLQARIVPPTPTSAGRAVPLQNTMSGTLALGLAGDPNDRTLDLFVVPNELHQWARPGVTAQLEIVTDATTTPELAIPLAAVQRDGLTPVIFRRDPSNPNEAIRMEADLGKDDGRWVALLSGVRDGDQIVLDGAFQLMLATSGSIQKGGHFHPDGNFHQGEDH